MEKVTNFFKKIAICGVLCIILLSIFCGVMQNCLGVAFADTEEVNISSKSAYLLDVASGEVLFAKNETEHLPVASMVKMMTILISLEELDAGNVDLSTLITTTENASSMGGSQVFLDPCVDYSFEDLL